MFIFFRHFCVFWHPRRTWSEAFRFFSFSGFSIFRMFHIQICTIFWRFLSLFFSAADGFWPPPRVFRPCFWRPPILPSRDLDPKKGSPPGRTRAPLAQRPRALRPRARASFVHILRRPKKCPQNTKNFGTKKVRFSNFEVSKRGSKTCPLWDHLFRPPNSLLNSTEIGWFLSLQIPKKNHPKNP